MSILDQWCLLLLLLLPTAAVGAARGATAEGETAELPVQYRRWGSHRTGARASGTPLSRWTDQDGFMDATREWNLTDDLAHGEAGALIGFEKGPLGAPSEKIVQPQPIVHSAVDGIRPVSVGNTQEEEDPRSRMEIRYLSPQSAEVEENRQQQQQQQQQNREIKLRKTTAAIVRIFSFMNKPKMTAAALGSLLLVSLLLLLRGPLQRGG